MTAPSAGLLSGGTILELTALKLVGHMAHEFYLKEVALNMNLCWGGGFVGKMLGRQK